MGTDKLGILTFAGSTFEFIASARYCQFSLIYPIFASVTASTKDGHVQIGRLIHRRRYALVRNPENRRS
jgi:hypothetical protein